MGPARSARPTLWMPPIFAGAVPNLAYCFWLLRRNRTGGKFIVGGTGHWVLAFVMAAFWFGSTLLYGSGDGEAGVVGLILGWAVFMSLIVIMATLLGVMNGPDGRTAGGLPLRIQWSGVAMLVLAVFVLANTSLYLS